MTDETQKAFDALLASAHPKTTSAELRDDLPDTEDLLADAPVQTFNARFIPDPKPLNLQEMVALFDQSRSVPMGTYRMYIDGELVSEGSIQPTGYVTIDSNPHGPENEFRRRYQQHYQPCQWDHLHLESKLPRPPGRWGRFRAWLRRFRNSP